MKNIHILPTDKPSRLCLDSRDTLWFAPRSGYSIADGKQNIYITNDEEIKKGDWVYYENGDLKGIHKIVNGQRPKTMILRKIILTTDQDLIKDCVQAIDDEFLEWFVKNSSYEEIEVVNDEYVDLEKDEYVDLYKIIIPKEEPNNQH